MLCFLAKDETGFEANVVLLMSHFQLSKNDWKVVIPWIKSTQTLHLVGENELSRLEFQELLIDCLR